MRLLELLNSNSVVVTLGHSPQWQNKRETILFADFTDQHDPVSVISVEPGADFFERMGVFLAERTQRVKDRYGITEAYIQVSDGGQIRIVVFTADHKDTATWIPFPDGTSGSWYTQWARDR